MTIKPLQHNGVTTEMLACTVGRIILSEHETHLHRPGTQTEYFTCPGGVKCEACAKVVWRDEMVAHVQAEHLEPTGPRRDPSADAMAATWPGAKPPVRIMCPESAVEPNKRQCSFKSDADLYAVRRHLWLAHGWSVKQVAEYLADPWLSDEPRAAWKDRIFARKYGLGSSDALTAPPMPKCPKSGCELTHPHLHAAAEVDAFLNPKITLEEIVSAGKLNPDEPMDFHEWWVAMADREAPTVQRKAEEYGTNSLVEMGRIWARAQGRDVTDLEAVEIGCFLYAYGKIQRVADALLKGKSPNVDSWKDAAIYAMMVMYSREKGTWP